MPLASCVPESALLQFHTLFVRIYAPSCFPHFNYYSILIFVVAHFYHCKNLILNCNVYMKTQVIP